jgi:PAS domain S-box-containing protein
MMPLINTPIPRSILPAFAQEALRESEQRLRAIFEQAAVGIAISELDGRLAEVNAKFVEILGYSAEELSRLSAYQVSHPDDVAKTRANVERLLAGEIREYSYEKRYIRKDGATVWTLTSVGVLRDAAGRPRQFIGVIEDITGLKHAQEAERAARAEAERMSNLKDEFLATLSHELRTPLGAILGWAHVISHNRALPDEDLRRAMSAIERNARAQTQLIEDLLDMARISSGQVRLDLQPVEPAAIIEAALDTVGPAAEAKGLALNSVLDPRAGPISGDAGRLQQVVCNLLSNAVKFTPMGGKVQVALARVGSRVEISVTDTGVGIRPEFVPHVFERFRQADATTTRRHGGLGLGLSIAKHLVELHGGTLEARSAGEGRGATFVMGLPVAAVERAGATEARPVWNPPDLAGLKVLAVDDQPDARDLIRRVLEDCGARVIIAGSAAEALEALSRERPDVLLSDIGMPDVDGFDLLRRVRAMGAAGGGDIPAIALTAFARSEDRTKALRAGFRMHMSKPVEPAELLAAVASVGGRTSL